MSMSNEPIDVLLIVVILCSDAAADGVADHFFDFGK